MKSKRFWTLVSAVIAALAAFFLASCVSMAHIRSNGVHIDTIKTDFVTKSKDFVL